MSKISHQQNAHKRKRFRLEAAAPTTDARPAPQATDTRPAALATEAWTAPPTPPPTTGAELLLAQLAEEFELLLEDTYTIHINWEYEKGMAGSYPVAQLRRIFDNLISNIQKYADPQKPVNLHIATRNNRLLIEQSNHILQNPGEDTDSHKIGLKNIKEIAAQCGGNMETRQYHNIFEIRLTLMSGYPL